MALSFLNWIGPFLAEEAEVCCVEDLIDSVHSTIIALSAVHTAISPAALHCLLSYVKISHAPEQAARFRVHFGQRGEQHGPISAVN